MAIKAKRRSSKTQAEPKACRSQGPLWCLLPFWVALATIPAWADSVASKNKEGNRLFETGSFQEAEKAYLDAQAESPGRPELLYNLGNSLIKQKKYEQALQSLHQATSKAAKTLEASSWYNIGDALFEMSDFKEAAAAYVQSLKINPSDRDAKHNLELALRNLKQQENKRSAQDSEAKNQKPEQNKESPANRQNQDQGQRQQPQGPTQRQEHDQNLNLPSEQRERRDETISKERALQILDALRNEELAERRKLQEHRARSKAIGKDW